MTSESDGVEVASKVPEVEGLTGQGGQVGDR